MGRVYEALKRAAAQNGANGNGKGDADSSKSPNGTKAIAPVAADKGRNGSHAAAESAQAGASRKADAAPPELFLRQSKHFQSPEAARTSASTEHTGTTGGSALPAGQASRAAGATLGAAGSARTPEFCQR